MIPPDPSALQAGGTQPSALPQPRPYPKQAQGQSMQGQPTQEQSMQGQPAQGQSMQGQPAQGQSMQGQQAQGQFMQGQPTQGQSTQRQQAQGQSMQGQQAQGQSMQGGQQAQGSTAYAHNVHPHHLAQAGMLAPLASSSMTEQDQCHDLLQTEKNMGHGYTLAAMEASSPELAQMAMQMLHDVKQAQQQLFQYLHNQGKYPIEGVQSSQIRQKTQQLSKMKQEFPYS